MRQGRMSLEVTRGRKPLYHKTGGGQQGFCILFGIRDKLGLKGTRVPPPSIVAIR